MGLNWKRDNLRVCRGRRDLQPCNQVGTVVPARQFLRGGVIGTGRTEFPCKGVGWILTAFRSRARQRLLFASCVPSAGGTHGTPCLAEPCGACRPASLATCDYSAAPEQCKKKRSGARPGVPESSSSSISSSSSVWALWVARRARGGGRRGGSRTRTTRRTEEVARDWRDVV